MDGLRHGAVSGHRNHLVGARCSARNQDLRPNAAPPKDLVLMNTIAILLADGGLYIGGGALLIIILFLLAWMILRR